MLVYLYNISFEYGQITRQSKLLTIFLSLTLSHSFLFFLFFSLAHCFTYRKTIKKKTIPKYNQTFISLRVCDTWLCLCVCFWVDLKWNARFRLYNQHRQQCVDEAWRDSCISRSHCDLEKKNSISITISSYWCYLKIITDFICIYANWTHKCKMFGLEIEKLNHVSIHKIKIHKHFLYLTLLAHFCTHCDHFKWFRSIDEHTNNCEKKKND